MRIVSLVDNVPGSCPGEHGLSLYVELDSGFKILFDTGQDGLFCENAERLGIDLSSIDAVVISHGHYDHGGGLGCFFERNPKTCAFLQRSAFEPHYSMKESGLKNIGLDGSLAGRYQDRIKLCDDHETVSPGIELFTCSIGDFPAPDGNSSLIGSDGVSKDDFSHEQSMLVRDGGKVYVFGGCAHRGAANILASAKAVAGSDVDCFISGMHLMRGGSAEYVESLASTLLGMSDCHFVTMHCTGEDNFLLLKSMMGDRISYLASGGAIIDGQMHE